MITLNERQPVDKDMGPGLELKSVRERKGITLNEAAEALHLRPSIVDAIENSHYDLLPGELFLKGYVRSYARLLGLDEERAVISLQQQLAQIKEQSEPDEPVKRPKKVWIPLVGILILIILIAVYVLEFQYTGWQSSTSGSDAPTPVENQEQPTPEPDRQESNETILSNRAEPPFLETEPSTSISESTPESTNIEESAIADKVVEDESVGEAAIETLDVDQATVEAPLSQTLESEPTSLIEDVSELPEQVETGLQNESDLQNNALPREVVQDSSNASPESLSVSTTGQLTMKFTGDCWVTVRNGEGRRVIATLKRNGQTLQYEGITPFTVVVGDVSVTELLFNEKPIEWSNYRVRNNRVELTLQ